MSLYITLPFIDPKWIERNTTDLSVAGVDDFRSQAKSNWSEEFECMYEAKAHNVPAIGQHNIDCKVIDAIPKIVQAHFMEYQLWRKQVTGANLDEYNGAIGDIITSIADVYAEEWCKAIGCERWFE